MNLEHLARTISDWIALKVRQSGARGVVIGLSGGVDSATVMALSQRALGQRVLAVIMPCESIEDNAKDALEIAGRFRVPAVTVPLDKPYRQLVELLPDATQTARANLKARLRMAVLYSYANTLNYLVAGTGNRTEIAVGYFTKYGDGAADILPIGGLLKRQVRELARCLEIPASIIDKTPSAGLWLGQTDEEELGLSYELLDRVIEALDEDREPAVEPQVAAKVKALIEASHHKRALPPICPVGSPPTCIGTALGAAPGRR